MKAAWMVVVVAVMGCSSDHDAGRSAEAVDSVTTAQRDSALAASPIPGGGAVGAARGAAAAADAKTATTDSVLRDQ